MAKIGPSVETAADRHAGYLRSLGERVRGLRARRGMTRRQLAKGADISERYLALIESGQGNVSVALLRQLAQAIHVPVEDLLREGPERPIELTMIERRLGRLPETDRTEALAVLLRHLGIASERRGRIALVGLRGAGKSTLGAALARRLDVPFVRLDAEVEREAGMSLSEVFSLAGQETFRRLERRSLERMIERHDRAVIETGGSLVSEPGTYALLLESCVVVWVSAAPEDHMARVQAQGDFRPMADNAEAMADLRRILGEREPLYGRADIRIDTQGRAVETCLGDLERALQRHAK